MIELPQSLNIKKDIEWMKQYALALANRSANSLTDKTKDEICWKYFNGNFSPDDWKYLTEVKTKEGGEEFSLPAKIRNISIQRAPINLLVSQASRRPFPLSVFVCDKASKEEKHKNMFIDMLNKIKEELLMQKMEIAQVISSMQQQLQQIEQMVQQEPQSEEEAQQMQELQQMIPQIQLQINMGMEELEKKGQLNQEKLEELDEYYTYNYQELKEILAQKGMRKLIIQHKIRAQRVLGMTDRMVTGREYRYVDFSPINKRCEYSYVNSSAINFPKISGIDKVQDGPWVTYTDVISFQSFMDVYGDSPDLNDDILKAIEKNSAAYSDGYNELDVQVDGLSSGVKRTRVWWKAPHKVTIGSKENKNAPDTDFKHFYTEMLTEKEAKKYKNLKTRYIVKVYEAVVINDSYVINAREKTEALVDKDNYMRRYLPIIGNTFSNPAKQPYSLIWATKDLQDLYVLVHFHRELLLAVSGVKGQIIDLAQIPDGMTPEEHRYHKKTGNLYIQTVKKTGRINSPYNQWKDYDDTLPASVQYLDNMLLAIKEAALETIGVPRQRLGQIVNTDQVGTSQIANEQSALITEILFFEHDEIEADAMNQLINYYCKYCWDEGAILDIKTPEGVEYIKIPPGILSESDYEILYKNSTEEERAKAELLQMAFQRSAQGQLPFEKVLDFYDMESIAQLKKSFRHWSKKAREIAEKSQMNVEEAKKQAAVELKNMDNEMKLQLQQNQLQIEQYRLKLEEAKLEMQKQIEEAKLEIQNKKIDIDATVKMADITSERDIELTYLQEQKRGSVVDEQIRAVQLQLQALQMKLDGLMQNKQANIALKKVKVDEKKAAGQKKEKIKD